MRIALAQMEVVLGKPKKNLETMLSMMDEARRERADLVAFPEMCVGGYLLGDRWLEDGFCLDLMEYNDVIRKESDGIAVAYGNIFVDNEIEKRTGSNGFHPNKDGRSRKYNAAYVFQNGKPAERVRETRILPAGVQPKILLPNYRFFDDERYFFSLEDEAKDFGVELEDITQPFFIEVGGQKIPIGFELCEDLWCADYRRGLEAFNPTKILINNGARAIVNLSASPWTYGKNSARDRRVQFLKKESGEEFVPFFYVNCAGAQNNGKNIITFDGGSTVYNKDGLPVVLSKAPYGQELIVTDDADLMKDPIERKEKSRIAQKYEAIITGIKHVKDMIGIEEDPLMIVAMSGGVDSAVAASLVSQAIGRDKVLGINMPTRYNSPKTRDSAEHVARKLGIPYTVVPIEELAEANERTLEGIDIGGRRVDLDKLTRENLQAKIRGTSVVSNLAGRFNAVFTNNGNKDEVALGYATLYGDWGGAFSVLGDLTKAEIYEMARFLNEEIYHEEVIPEILLPDRLFRFRDDQVQPSAELEHGQVDPIRVGYHCALIEAMTDYKKKTPEEILRWYLEGTMEEKLGISYELLERWGVHKPAEFIEDLEWLVKTIQRNVFKRVQSPPIIVTSKSSYGYDIRESILPFETTQEYERLKNKILTEIETYKPRGGGKYE